NNQSKCDFELRKTCESCPGPSGESPTYLVDISHLPPCVGVYKGFHHTDDGAGDFHPADAWHLYRRRACALASLARRLSVSPSFFIKSSGMNPQRILGAFCAFQECNGRQGAT